MDYVKPVELVGAAIDAGASKVVQSTRVTVVRAIMGGALLTMGAAFAVTVSVQTGSALLGAMLFPVGFIVLYLLGYDLLTGLFVFAPLAWLARRPGITGRAVMRNWGLVFLGNFIGAFTVALVMAIVFTYGFSVPPNEIGQAIGHIGEGRTLGYAEHGAAGMLTLFVRGALCNWMVSTGALLAMASKSTLGKALGMWMPVMLFFYMGFEHSIVNMFLFPSGLLLGGDFTVGDYLIWNEIPTVIGNLVGGLLFTALPLYLAYVRGGTWSSQTSGSSRPPAAPRDAGSGTASPADSPAASHDGAPDPVRVPASPVVS